MARTVPGSGAVIKPNFNKDFGILSVEVLNGGTGYDPLDPPRLTIDNCGTPEIEALLYPYIDTDSGRITYVRVLNSGKGYDPLRVEITPRQDSVTVIDTFDAKSIFASSNTSVTSSIFVQYDRFRVITNALPDPSPYNATGLVYAQNYDHTFVYRGGKEVPTTDSRTIQEDTLVGIMANGTELHTPDFFDLPTGIPTITNFNYDVVKTPTILGMDQYDGTTTLEPTQVGRYYYTTSNLIDAFAAPSSVFSIVPYYKDTNYSGDKSRHANGHSKIMGYSYDGYPIYGPWGFTDALIPSAVSRMRSGFRLKTGVEVSATRPAVNTPATTTYTVDVVPNPFGSGNVYRLNGGGFTNAAKTFLNLDRGSTYIFNQDDPTNTGHAILFSIFGSSSAQGWHTGGQTLYDSAVVWQQGVTYYIENIAVDYETYTSQFNGATLRRVEITVPVEAPDVFYYFCYNHANMADRINAEGYVAGTFVQDYLFDSTNADLDDFNGRYCVTPEYPNGTYAYFLTEDTNGDPAYPYAVGPRFFGKDYKPGQTLPAINLESPRGAQAEAVIYEEDQTDNQGNVTIPAGALQYVNMESNGDGYFGAARVEILGGEGSGAVGNAVTQTVTGLSLISQGRDYSTPPSLFFQGGGGAGATGVAYIDTTGKLTSIAVDDGGQFYDEAPYVLIDGGGGIGAKAKARIFQGRVVGVDVIDPGAGYTGTPNVIFTKLVNLKRKVRNRQAYNSVDYSFCGLASSVGSTDTNIFVDNTDAFDGSGTFILGSEIIRYTGKQKGRFTGCIRGTNFRYDQRVILDTGQDNTDGVSTYNFKVGDKVIRRIDNSSNKIAKVYDWRPESRELFVKFEVDDLAFIDAGIPSSEELTIAFDAGLADASPASSLPHEVETEIGSSIVLFEGDPVYNVKVTPPTILLDSAYVDDDDDGIANLNNTGTQFENQIALDGGLFNSLYGIEETVGGQNTTLFQVGDGINDTSNPVKIARVEQAGALGDGVEHNSTLTLILDVRYTNNQNFFPDEIITGQQSGIIATVTSWNNATRELVVRNITPFNTGNVALGTNGSFYTFSKRGSIIDMKIINPGTNYTATPTIAIESSTTGVDAVATATMTGSGDQILSVNITTEGYGYVQSVDGTFNLHPTVTVTNDAGDTTGAGAVLEAVLGGEEIVGNNGARWRIKDIQYDNLIRNEFA